MLIHRLLLVQHRLQSRAYAYRNLQESSDTCAPSHSLVLSLVGKSGVATATPLTAIIMARGVSERITSAKQMKQVLIEEWDRITVEEINREIDVGGDNNFHA